MPAELIDINQEFDQGNQFTLYVCEALANILDNSFRIIVKYQGQDLPEYDDDKKNIVICTSRECHSVPEEFYRDDVLMIFQHYFMLDKWGHPILNPMVTPLPLGTFLDIDINEQEIIPIPEREYDFCFMGQIPHTGKRDSFHRNLNKILDKYKDKYKIFTKFTDGFAEGLTEQEYLSVLGNSKLSLCPQGAISDETFRFFESILMGTVPVVEHLPKLWYYECAPHMKTRSWNELEQSIAQSLNFMQTPNFRTLLYNIADYVNNLLNPEQLALHLKEFIEYRIKTKDQYQSDLINLRKMLKDEKVESTEL